MNLTVLMTVYNGMPYLEEAVSSILNQTYGKFTFLIVNNGSTDGTKAYLEGLTDPRLVIHHLPTNIGRTNVLNFALKQATTELIAIIDADDIAAHQRLQEQMTFMEHHPEVTLLGSDVVYINEKGRTLGTEEYPTDHEALRDNLPVFNQFSHAACMFRKLPVMEIGGYPEQFPYAQDFGLWINLLQKGALVASLPLPLAYIRVHSAQATRSPELAQSRHLDNLHLTEAMQLIPHLSTKAMQTARLRMAQVLWKLGRKGDAFAAARDAFLLAPLGIFSNGLLGKRLKKDITKLYQRIKTRLQRKK